jgi:general stress protein YciG
MTEKKSKRGFASMTKEQQRAIASKGGKAAHKLGRAHEFTSAEATIAGRKGGIKVSRNGFHMAEIGRKGGLKRKPSRRKSVLKCECEIFIQCIACMEREGKVKL